MTPRVGCAGDGQFPEPDGLAPAVRFWSATFTQYQNRDVIIHDRIQPGLVYEVVRDVGPDDDVRVQTAIQNAVARVRRATRACGLSLFEAPASTRSEPLARIRTHRGMREAFAQGLVAERLPSVARCGVRSRRSGSRPIWPRSRSSNRPTIRASSRAGAVGLWQLRADVAGERYVRVDAKVDERRDPSRASLRRRSTCATSTSSSAAGRSR
jgi:hypothetical protein